MEPKDRELLVATWIEHHRVGRISGSRPEETFWAWEKLYDITREDPELAWELILEVLASDKSDVTIGNLAAGPVEDLLVKYGERFINRIESQAEHDPTFNELLGGVWGDYIPPDIWRRIKKIRKRVW